MNSLILHTTARFLASLLVVAALLLVWRGHNEAGGGFAGGLMASSAFVLYALAMGSVEARRALRAPVEMVIAAGLAAALLSAALPLALGQTLFVGQWVELAVPGGEPLKLGTPLLFDVGVAITVVGVVQAIFLTLMDEEN